MQNLELIEKKLIELKKKTKKHFEYNIPTIWYGNSENPIIENVNFFDFHLNQIKFIKESKTQSIEKSSKWSDNAIIYNMFIRLSSAFDHNNDGKINIDPTKEKYKETGTFLKTIAILPYLKSLGINTLYFLPVTSIGIDEKKGTLGSPYSIRNPYKLDENLSEPILDMEIETQFKALIEAAHHLGFKVVCEFVFRTASVDSDLALEHPEWFYWIKSKINNRGVDAKNEKQYGPSIFTKEELSKIKEKITAGDFTNLPSPHLVYKEMFTPTPPKVARVEQKIRGLLDKKNEVKIPGAFADWPPNDTQPVWSDVTYLKLYTLPEFNYIAYNTVRMYDKKLTNAENEAVDLWNYIIDIIPYYQENFGIDGVMIDMGHALPPKLREHIVEKAREINPEFVFWEENFVLSKKSADEGYNAVLGYLPFDQHIHWKMRQIIKLFSEQKLEIPFFATPETHNTPRAFSRFENIEYSKLAYLINSFLPIPLFIHSGFELGEKHPVNTGLDFKPEDYEKYPSEKLPLFSESMLNWNSENNIISFIQKVNEIKLRLIQEDNNIHGHSIVDIESNKEEIVCFLRRCNSTKKEILIAGNFHHQNVISAEIDLLEGAKSFKDELSNNEFQIENNKLKLNLKPFEFVVGEIGLIQ